jgi:hypothetical protein
MQASELTFGIEIETTLPVGATPVGPHGSGVQVPWLPAGWLADADPSIHYSRGRMACEFVSPVLKGGEGLAQLMQALALIRQHRANVNRSCGLHVHVGFDRNDQPALARLVTLAANFEKALYAASGSKNRERGRWCGSVRRHQTVAGVQAAARYERYHVLNLNNLMTGEKPTVEFRVFGASLNTKKAVTYLRLCLALVERAYKAKRVTNWTAKPPVETSPIHREGEGQTEMTRLFYQIGWTKGRTDHTYGDVPAPGAPSVRQMKKELMRLAKKYDEQR